MTNKLLSILSFILISALIIWQLGIRIANPVNVTQFYGLKHISENELRTSLARLDLNNKSLIEINSKQISSYLAKLPLIENVKTKALLLPSRSFHIYVTEAEPWAFYRGALLDKDLKVLVNSRAKARLYESPALNGLYSSFYDTKTSDLISLVSYNQLPESDLKVIKTIYDLIEANLQIINNQKIREDKTYIPEKINSIKVDVDNNLTLATNNLQFFTGRLNATIIDRVKRLDAVVPKIIEMSTENPIEYVDLSLTTDEVILGKPQEEQAVVAN